MTDDPGRERRRLLRVGIDEELDDPAAAEREGLALARELRARVAVDREAARRLRDYLDKHFPSK